MINMLESRTRVGYSSLLTPVFLSAAFIIGATNVQAGQLESGEAPYERCALCHGLFGNTPRDKFPKLAAQRPAYLMSQLQAFHGGVRTNDGGQMQAVVTELEADQFQTVVDWFSSQAAPTATINNDISGIAETIKLGEEAFFGAGCGQCHNASVDADEDIPYLTAQHASYLSKQMRDFRDSKRELQHGAVGREAHLPISGFEGGSIDAIAAYLAATPRQE